jgi:hypothetical protein
MSEPIVLVVRRGNEKRFEALRRQTSDLNVEVIWDRRSRSRRHHTETKPATERRSNERRQPQTFTWNAADFAVAVPARSAN